MKLAIASFILSALAVIVAFSSCALPFKDGATKHQSHRVAFLFPPPPMIG